MSELEKYFTEKAVRYAAFGFESAQRYAIRALIARELAGQGSRKVKWIICAMIAQYRR